MEYSKLDARLSEALDEPTDTRAVFEVFIHLDKDARTADLQLLARLGVPAPDRPGSVLTVRLSREALSAVSEIASVRQVSLVRRLRPSAK